MSHQKSYRSKYHRNRLDLGTVYNKLVKDEQTTFVKRNMIGRPVVSATPAIGETALRALQEFDIAFSTAYQGLVYATPKLVLTGSHSQRQTPRDIKHRVATLSGHALSAMTVERGLVQSHQTEDGNSTRVRLFTHDYQVPIGTDLGAEQELIDSRINSRSMKAPRLELGELSGPKDSPAIPIALEYLQTSLPVTYQLGAIAVIQKGSAV